MQHLYKLLEYVVENYPSLAEARADEFMQALVKKFKGQAEKSSLYRGRLTDDDIKYAIEQFNKYKESLAPEDREIADYSIQELLNFLRTKKNFELPSEKEELPEEVPPVVYETPELIIFDGSDEGRCVTYGKGEKWCITQGSFANYRYSEEKKFPTFYLVKDKTLPSSNPKSFFVVMVGRDNTYKASDRSNNDIGGRGSEWERWENWDYVENHFPSVRGLKQYFKYRQVPAKELVSKGRITLQSWIDANTNQKKSILTTAIERKNVNGPVNDITWEVFFKRVLPKFKEIGDWLPKQAYSYPSIFGMYYDSFTDSQKKSIIAHLNTPGHDVNITASDLWKSERLSHDFKLDLVKAGRVPSDAKVHLYVTKNKTLVSLDLTTKTINVIVEYSNGVREAIELDKATEHYLANDPNFASIPRDLLIRTVNQFDLSQQLISKSLEGSKDVERVRVGDKEYGIEVGKDFINAFQISGPKEDSKAFPDEVLDKITDIIGSDEKASKAFLDNLIRKNIGPFVNKPNKLKDTLLSLPPEKRVLTQRNNDKTYFQMITDDYIGQFPIDDGRVGRLYKIHIYNDALRDEYGGRLDTDKLKQALTYIHQNLIEPTDNLEPILRNIANKGLTYPKEVLEILPDIVRATPDAEQKLAYANDTLYLIDKTMKDRSLKINPSSRNVIAARLSQATYNQLLGTQPQATQAAQPAAQAPPAVSQGGDVNVIEIINRYNLGMRGVPDAVVRRLQQGGTAKNVNNDRGSSTRNQNLRGVGRVREAYQLAGTASAIYFILLTQATTRVAAIAMQPGNIHLLLAPGHNAMRMRSADDLERYIDGLNLQENKSDMKTNKDIIRKLVENLINENQLAPAPSRPATTPGTRPEPGIAEPGTEEEEDDDNPFTPPTEAPDTGIKAKEKEHTSALVKRFKSEN